MLTIGLQKLKTSLNEAIEKWANEQAEIDDDWGALDMSWSDHAGEYMTDAAFTVLMAQKDLNDYLKNDGQLK